MELQGNKSARKHLGQIGTGRKMGFLNWDKSLKQTACSDGGGRDLV